MKLLSSLILFSFAFNLKADEIKLATITSDAITDTTIFYLETNPDGSVQAMRYVSTSPKGEITDDVTSRIDEVIDEGVLIKEMEEREVVRLYLEDFKPNNGARVRLRYLVNGATGIRRNHYLKLIKTAEGYFLSNEENKLINTVFVRGNWSRILRRWIGVDEIQTSFDQNKH
jgi:hypothetical protein